MKSYLKNIGRIGTFLIVTMLAIMIGLLIITLNNKTSLHLTLNYGHNEVFDVFFKYLTHAGDGVFAILLVIITSAFFWKKYKWTYPIIGLCTIALSGITAQALKHFVFPDADRPLRFIGKKFLSLVDGVTMNEYYSFPSGHTTTAFALYAFLAFFVAPNKKGVQIAFALLAVLVGYSRIYLSQHFLEDVVAGAFLGAVSFLVVHLVARIAGKKI